VNAVVELEEEGGYRTVEVIFERPVMSKPTPRIVVFVEFADEDGGVGILEEGAAGGALKQERNAR
jgi:hypothetical protein